MYVIFFAHSHSESEADVCVCLLLMMEGLSYGWIPSNTNI